MVSGMRRLVEEFARVGLVASALCLAGWGCGGQAENPEVQVQLFGWAGGENSDGSFVGDLAEYPGAEQLTVKLTKPGEERILETEQAELSEGELQLPELSLEKGLRLDFDLVGREGGRGTRVASGATPVFDPESSDGGFRVMLTPVRDFAPVGAQLGSSGGGFSFGEVQFDDSAANGAVGRVGHRAVRTDGGDVLVVGGARLGSDLEPGTSPSIEAVHDDVQRFRASTGVVEDISVRAEEAADRLRRGRAFHTVTPIGDDRYLVVGGFTKQSGNLGLAGSVELIDMEADAGERVQRTGLDLSTPRALHTATYRPSSDDVVVAGGIASGGEASSSTEILDLETSTVQSGPELNEARARHRAFLVEDEGAVWLIGGRDGSSAHASTEVLRGTSEVSSGAAMGEERYNFAATLLSPKVVMVCGGYGSLGQTGDPSDTCQVGRLGQGRWGQAIQMGTPRGGPEMVKLTQSKNVILLGGRDDAGVAVTAASRLNFQGPDAANLYEVETGVGEMYKSRYEPSVTQLGSGMLLLTGGLGFAKQGGGGEECRRPEGADCNRSALRSFEYYNPGDVVRAASDGGDGDGDTTGEGSGSDDSTT